MGWWRLTFERDEGFFWQLSDADKQHIATLIKDGYVEGELVEG